MPPPKYTLATSRPDNSSRQSSSSREHARRPRRPRPTPRAGRRRRPRSRSTGRRARRTARARTDPGRAGRRGCLYGNPTPVSYAPAAGGWRSERVAIGFLRSPCFAYSAPARRTLASRTAVAPKKDGMLQTTLDNGLHVILVEDHSAPVVALNVWVRVGSADERDEQWGMAHVHEHMLFKGTERRGVGEIASTVEGAGGNINAFTSYDMTVYHITMASRDAGVGFDVLADAMQSSTFDAAELAKEEEVVIEEIRRSDDSPDNLALAGAVRDRVPDAPVPQGSDRHAGERAQLHARGPDRLLPLLVRAEQHDLHRGRRLRSRGGARADQEVVREREAARRPRAPARARAGADGATRRGRAERVRAVAARRRLEDHRVPEPRHALSGSARHGARRRRQLAPVPRGEGPRAARARHPRELLHAARPGAVRGRRGARRRQDRRHRDGDRRAGAADPRPRPVGDGARARAHEPAREPGARARDHAGPGAEARLLRAARRRHRRRGAVSRARAPRDPRRPAARRAAVPGLGARDRRGAHREGRERVGERGAAPRRARARLGHAPPRRPRTSSSATASASTRSRTACAWW